MTPSMMARSSTVRWDRSGGDGSSAVAADGDGNAAPITPPTAEDRGELPDEAVEPPASMIEDEEDSVEAEAAAAAPAVGATVESVLACMAPPGVDRQLSASVGMALRAAVGDPLGIWSDKAKPTLFS